MSATPPPSALPLEEVRRLAKDRAWRVLVERVDSGAQDGLAAEPEMALHYADALWRVGAPDRALAVAEGAEPTLWDRGDRWLLLNLINIIGIALFEQGRVQDAGQRFEQLLDLATQWGSDEYAARASNNLGVLAGVARRYDLALTSYQRALAAYQRLGYLRGLAQAHYNLGLSYRELGFGDEADAHYGRAIRFAEQSGSEDVVALAESDRGLLRVHNGDPRTGAVLAARARDRFARLSDPVRRAETLRVLAAAARADQRPDDALSLLDEALSVARAHHSSWLHAEVQRDRSLLLLERGDVQQARAGLLDAGDRFAALGADAEAARLRDQAGQIAP